MTRTPSLLAGAAALAVLLVACGDDAEPVVSTASTESAPSSVADSGPEQQDPTSIVSLSPTATEMLFAIGAGDQVVAADSYSTFPAEAPTTELSAYEPNLEAIAGFDPDLVVLAAGGDIEDQLAEVGIDTLVLDAAVTIDDTYAQIEQLGALTGHDADAAQVVADMQHDIDEIVASVPATAEPLTYYHELDDTFYSVTSQTFIGNLYGLLGLENIADPVDDGSAFGYPQLSAEYIIDADPDLIFLADTKCCGQTAASVGDRPGWDTLTAVARGGVVELDDDVASRWGPRVVDLLRTVASAVAATPAS
ncbi:MAG: ABC transporter substrate-binding protein [Ilumatobacteraceae bacterium]